MLPLPDVGVRVPSGQRRCPDSASVLLVILPFSVIVLPVEPGELSFAAPFVLTELPFVNAVVPQLVPRFLLITPEHSFEM